MTDLIKILFALNYLFLLMVINILFLTSKNKKSFFYIVLVFTLISIALNLHFNSRYNDAYIPVLLISNIIFYIFIRNSSSKNINKNIFINFLFIVPIIIMSFQFFLLHIYEYNLFFSLYTQAIVLFLLFLVIRNNSEFITDGLILKMITIFCFFNSILGFLQLIFNHRILPGGTGAGLYHDGWRRIIGFAGGMNAAGNLSAILFIVTLFVLLKDKSLWSFIAFSLNLLFLTLTMTRIAYMGSAMGLFVFFIHYRNFSENNFKIFLHLKKILIAIMLIVILIFSYQIFILELYEFVFSPRGDTHQHRIEQFQSVFEIIPDNIYFGIGAGQYSYFLMDYYDKMDLSIHSQWLNLMVETGIISFISFFILEIILFIILFRKYKEDKWFIIALFITKTIVSNFNANQYYFVVNNIFYFIVFGLVFCNKTDVYVKEEK